MPIDETAQRNQSDKFKALAREVEADEDEARWDARLAEVVAHKPIASPDPPTPPE